MAFDNSGNLYVALNSFNAVAKFSPSGTLLPFVASGLNGPAGLAFDSHGNLFVANANNNTIEKVDANGVGTPFVITGLNFPQGLAVDSSDNLYVANSLNHEIDKFDANGTPSVFAQTGVTVSGLAFGSHGDLYLTVLGGINSVGKLDPNGQEEPGLASGLADPVFLAVEQVPEPGTWALVALGIAALFGHRRLHRPLF